MERPLSHSWSCFDGPGTSASSASGHRRAIVAATDSEPKHTYNHKALHTFQMVSVEHLIWNGSGCHGIQSPMERGDTCYSGFRSSIGSTRSGIGSTRSGIRRICIAGARVRIWRAYSRSLRGSRSPLILLGRVHRRCRRHQRAWLHWPCCYRRRQ